MSAYFDVVAARGALLGALQAHFGGFKAARRIRRRVIALLRFWSRQLQRAYAFDPAVAITLAGMMVSAVEAGAKSWSAGVVERVAAESLCMAFITAGFAAAPAAVTRQRRQAMR